MHFHLLEPLPPLCRTQFEKHCYRQQISKKRFNLSKKVLFVFNEMKLSYRTKETANIKSVLHSQKLETGKIPVTPMLPAHCQTHFIHHPLTTNMSM